MPRGAEKITVSAVRTKSKRGRSMKQIIRFFSAVALMLSVGIFSCVAYGDIQLPDEYSVVAGSGADIGESVFSASASASPQGEYELEVKAFGVFPVKTARVKVSQRRYVTVGGEIFGIRLYTRGVLIVGSEEIETASGAVDPAARAGLKKGDIILEINGSPVSRNNDISSAVESSGGDEVELLIERAGKKQTVKLLPARSKVDSKFKAGLWVRDSSAGIGTVTFYDRKNGIFAGLGHAVCDVDTGEELPISGGDAVNAAVKGCYKGKDGSPGELCGVFAPGEIGALYENCGIGVYGAFSELPKTVEMPVAIADEVKTGKAQIISTVDADGPQYYDIEITKIYTKSGQRNMIIEVRDKRLIEKTGGIVQGMSGSPIVQNGMLVGAVTHVFINDPLKGYAIFAQTMAEEAERISSPGYSAAS